MTMKRRELLRLGLAAGLIPMAPNWFRALAAHAASQPKRPAKSCLMIWLNGGPSTIDLWDLKPGHENGGPFRPIETSAPGLQISENLPQLAKLGGDLAIIRSMATKEGDHTRASYLARTGNAPMGAIQFPGLGALVAKELVRDDSDLPGYVSIAPPGIQSAGLGYASGYLGPRFAPLMIGYEQGSIEDLVVPDLARANGVGDRDFDERLGLLDRLDRGFGAGRRSNVIAAQREAVAQAVRIMRPESARSFNLDDEPDRVRDAYGRSVFGQGCLMARRLIERGVPFVEVTLGGWDTHNENFPSVAALSRTLDRGLGSLLDDLKRRGLLDSTLVVCMGEFGRTPRINGRAGRDHWPASWSVMLAGGGLKTGQAIGRTSDDGMDVAERPTTIPDLLATICKALGIDPMDQNDSNVGRPIRIVDQSAKPIEELL